MTMTARSERVGPKLFGEAQRLGCEGCAHLRAEKYEIEDGNDYDWGFNYFCDAAGGEGVPLRNTPAWCPFYPKPTSKPQWLSAPDREGWWWVRRDGQLWGVRNVWKGSGGALCVSAHSHWLRVEEIVGARWLRIEEPEGEHG